MKLEKLWVLLLSCLLLAACGTSRRGGDDDDDDNDDAAADDDDDDTPEEPTTIYSGSTGADGLVSIEDDEGNLFEFLVTDEDAGDPIQANTVTLVITADDVLAVSFDEDGAYLPNFVTGSKSGWLNARSPVAIAVNVALAVGHVIELARNMPLAEHHFLYSEYCLDKDQFESVLGLSANLVGIVVGLFAPSLQEALWGATAAEAMDVFSLLGESLAIRALADLVYGNDDGVFFTLYISTLSAVPMMWMSEGCELVGDDDDAGDDDDDLSDDDDDDSTPPDDDDDDSTPPDDDDDSTPPDDDDDSTPPDDDDDDSTAPDDDDSENDDDDAVLEEVVLAAGLQWTYVTWTDFNTNDAVATCDDLSWGGYSDWRLPNINELRMLIVGCPTTEYGGACPVEDPGCLDRMACAQGVYFADCSGINCPWTGGGPGEDGCYWSPNTWSLTDSTCSSQIEPCAGSMRSSNLEAAGAGVWAVNYKTAGVTAVSENQCLRTRCVRSP